MKSFLLGSLLLSAAALAQNEIPPGTILPAKLNSSLNSRKNNAGQTITARVMQDVPLSPHTKIRAGSKVVGHVVAARAAAKRGSSQITLRFDRLEFNHRSVPISTNLRALASTMEVEDAQVPPTGPDRGTPWAWRTRNLIGGQVAYGDGGPVERGDSIVGKTLADGVLLPVEANRARGCRGQVAGNNGDQALWVFSSDACGLYGMPDVTLAHAGGSEPVGEITLRSSQGNLNVRAGSGLLLRIESAQH